MMRLLLDTHAFLWMQVSPERLAKKTRAVLTDADTELVLSVASVWEIGIKLGKDKLALPEPLETYVLSRTERSRIALLPIQLQHVVEAANLPAHHGDPFDRMLIAQARCERLTVVTADPWFRGYDVDVLAG